MYPVAPCPEACSSIEWQEASVSAGQQPPGCSAATQPWFMRVQAEREAAVGDLDAARATSKMLEEEVATLKQRLRQTEVRAAACSACTSMS
jgi:hypothetical protein